MRARDRTARLYPERSTAATRWQPAGRSGRVAVRGKLQREGKGRWRALVRRVEQFCKLEVARGWPGAAGGAAALAVERKQRGRLEVGEAGLVCNFQKFQGLYCKIAITFKLKLK